MKTYQIILIIIAIGVGIYLYNTYFKKKESMANIPDEINKLIQEGNNTTYYSEESHSEDDSEEEMVKRVNREKTWNTILEEEKLVNSNTSEDSMTLPQDSMTSVTGEARTSPKQEIYSEMQNTGLPPMPNGLISQEMPKQQGGPMGAPEELLLSGSSTTVANGAPIGVEPEQQRLRHHKDYTTKGMEKKECTVSGTSDMADDYINNLILNGQQYCSNNKCSDGSVIKNYRKDFFDFRDKVWDNSKKNDLAYKVTRLYLEGNTEMTGRVKGRKVKDVFDELTQAQTIRDKNCIKRDDYDDTLHQGYFTQNDQFLSRDNWMYMKDNKQKNKVVDDSIYGHDPFGSTHSLVEIGKALEH